MKPPLVLSPPAARLSLLASTALSATYPTSLKLIYAADEGAALSPQMITALRFVLMAGCAQLILGGTGKERSSGVDVEDDAVDAPSFWMAATELGVWACAGAQLNTEGLREVGVVRGSILLASINILTPVLSAVIGTEQQRRVPARTWLGCVVALVSTLVALSGDAASGAPVAALVRLSAGDEIVLGAACCYAVQQVRLGALIADLPARRLAAARLQTQAALSLVVLAFAGSGSAVLGESSSWSALSSTQASLIAASALAAVVGTLLQYQGQQVVPAAYAQPIYASAPILSALWAFAVLGEPVSQSELIGGAGIATAAALALDPPRPSRR